MSSLSAETLCLLRASFAAVDHSPSEPMWRGIEDLAEHLQQMAEGECEPRFYLSSLDPGVGKTQTIIHFLRALLASPQHNHVGVIIFLFTKQQIDEVVSQAKLNAADYAVLMTAEDEREQSVIDSGAPDPNTARVLFTTQQRLQLLCKNDKPFSDVEAYRFRRRPRQVRIWDEALSPAAEVIVRAYDIPDLLSTMSGLSPDFASALEKLRDDVQASDDRTVFLVPNLAAVHGLTLRRFLRNGKRLTQDERKLADNLWFLFGRYTSVRDDGKRGKALVSFRQSLPDDLAPIVILDASGRVKTAYEWWEHHRENLVRLGTAQKNYENLTVHVWDRGGGQASFEAERDRLRRTVGIVETINNEPDECWLVVCHKAYYDDIRRDVLRELEGDRARVSFIYWGIHRASNEFCDVRNIILAGTQFLPPSAYEGIARAARGLLPEEGQITAEMHRVIELGETADRILQAACRGLVRKAVDDKCPRCNVYILARPGSRVRELLPDIFPGCQIETWNPGPPHLPKKARKAYDFIVAWTAERPDELLSVKAVMEHIGETNKANFNRDVRNRTGFKLALEEAGISLVFRGKACVGFRRDSDPGEDEPDDPADIFRAQIPEKDPKGASTAV